MQARHRHLAAGVESRDGRSRVFVGDHPAAAVVRGGHDGERGFRHVDAELEAAFVDRRKTAADELRIAVRDVEIDVLVAVHLHLVIDGARDDVARRELGRGSRSVS